MQHVFLAMLLHLLLACLASDALENKWLYTSASVSFLVLALFRHGEVSLHSLFYGGWQTILLALFIHPQRGQ
jgi:hypothetical protein